MRRSLLAAMLLTLLAACAGASLSPAPTPGATGITATAGTASTGPGATIEPGTTPGLGPAPTPGVTETTATAGTASTGPGATIEPGTTPGPIPEPTPVASVPPLDQPDLRYGLVDQLGRPLFCDPDFYPIARSDEALLARQHLAAIRADAPTYAAIAAHLGMDPSAAPSASQVLAIYHEWKMLRALLLTDADGRFGFDYIAAAGTSGDTAFHVIGTIDASGTIAVVQRDPSGPPPCPICLARGTRIATPDGERRVDDLRPGMTVWTTDGAGQRVVGRVLALGSTPVPATHQVVHLVLSDGRTVDVSPGHRLPDGRRLSDLRPGDPVDGSEVVSATLEAYAGGATFDLLPSGSTGTYWANGIRLASTLEGRTERDQAVPVAGGTESAEPPGALQVRPVGPRVTHPGRTLALVPVGSGPRVSRLTTIRRGTAMARYTIKEEPASLAIELTELAGHQQELLEAFGECQAGSCSCPTGEYEKVAAMSVRLTDDRIAIRLDAKPGAQFDPAEIEACLDYTVAKTSA